MTKKEDKVSTSELVGQLRAAARLFKVLEYASDAAHFFHDLEKEQKGLEKAIESLNNEYDKILTDKATATSEVEALRIEKDNLSEEIRVVRQKASNEAADIIANAQEAAKKVEAQAEANVEKIKEREEEALKAKRVAEAAQADAESQLVAIEKQVKAAKAKFLKSFGE